MGLYDEPESPSAYDPEHEFMMRADGTVVPVPRPAGKGLKLEETFVPSNNDGSEASTSEESGGNEKNGFNYESNKNQQQHQARENVQVVPDDNDGRWLGNINGGHGSMPTAAGSFYFDDEDNVESDYLKPMMFSNMCASSNTSTPGYGWI